VFRLRQPGRIPKTVFDGTTIYRQPVTASTRLPAVLNLLGAVISLALLASTWFAQGIIVREARQFALSKTRTYLEPAIPKAEKISREIAAYRESPNEWLLEIAEGASDRARDFEFPEVRNPLARTALDFIYARSHFSDCLSRNTSPLENPRPFPPGNQLRQNQSAVNIAP
jgi:hypothetical protein